MEEAPGMTSETEVQATVTVNGRREPYTERSLHELLTSIGVDPQREGIAVAVNERITHRDEWKNIILRPGDRIEIVHAVAGG